MALDGDDFEMLKSLRRAVREGDEANANLLRLINTRQEKSDAQMLEAFNNIAKAVGSMSEEIKGLRRDLAPQLDKPKLGSPAQKSKSS